MPFAVPALITGAMWALPGNPAEIICAGSCTDEGLLELGARFKLNDGPVYYYAQWIWHAFQGDFGNSWIITAGFPVRDMIFEALPATSMVVGFALIPLVLMGVLAGAGLLPRRADSLWQLVGLVPAVILALLFAAFIQIQFGAISSEGLPGFLRILFGGMVLCVADGALAGTVVGTRTTFEEELKQRYVQMSLLRGETALSNSLPNVLPALIGQYRSRILHVLSGSVVVEVVLGVPGVGDLLWRGTLAQDFAVVTAAAWAFSLLSAFLLLFQGLSEVAVAMHVRRAPKVAA